MSNNAQSPSVPSAPTRAPLEIFFAGFVAVGFSYQPRVSAQKNFARLCKVSGWKGNPPARVDAHERFKDALVQQFNFLYGIDGNNVAAWQNLCKVIGIKPVPDKIEECRELVRDAHVNIVDLIEPVRKGSVKRFNTLQELAAYTKKTKKIFPKQNAYEGGLLKELLRELVRPYFGNRRNGGQKRKARGARRQVEVGVSSKSQ